MHVPFVFSSTQPYPPFSIVAFFAWGVALPALWWHFPQDSHSYKLSPLQGCWASATAPAFSGRLLYLQFTWGIASPSLLGAQGTPPSLLHVFYFFSPDYLLFSLFFSLFFVPLGGGQSVQRAMLIWPRVVCRSIVCHIAHLVVCIFPSSLGDGVWQRRSPPGFSI
jgi:hypothetical protein